MSRVLVVAHTDRQDALDAAARLIGWLEENGHSVEMRSPDGAAAGRADLQTDGTPSADLALAVSVGGDGTMLRSFDLVAAAGVPVLGVNVGNLGYLTEFDPGQLTSVTEAALAGRLDTSERMMVRAVVRRACAANGKPTDPACWTGLNEVVLEKRYLGHTVRLELWLDGDMFATYAADGLIVSTPTGSTAYSLSAGGAVVAPTHAALQVTPVAPHMLFDRSLLLPPESQIAIRVVSERPAQAAVDGREATMLHTGDELLVTQAPYRARFVTAGEDSFHRVLKHKFGIKDR